MAHTCPECGRLCHCKGDIDDIDFGEASWCECPCWEEDGDEDDDIFDDFDELCERRNPNDSRNL